MLRLLLPGKMRHDGLTRSCACIGAWLCRLLTFLATLLEQTDCQVLRLVANEIELGQDELDLFYELACARRLAEFHSFDEG